MIPRPRKKHKSLPTDDQVSEYVGSRLRLTTSAAMILTPIGPNVRGFSVFIGDTDVARPSRSWNPYQSCSPQYTICSADNVGVDSYRGSLHPMRWFHFEEMMMRIHFYGVRRSVTWKMILGLRRQTFMTHDQSPYLYAQEFENMHAFMR